MYKATEVQGAQRLSIIRQNPLHFVPSRRWSLAMLGNWCPFKASLLTTARPQGQHRQGIVRIRVHVCRQVFTYKYLRA